MTAVRAVEPADAAPARFNASRWTRDCLPQVVDNIVGRLTLIALGSIHAADEGYVTAHQVVNATGMTLELVVDALADAADRGVIRRVRGGFVPNQTPDVENTDVLERLELGRCIDCATCGAPSFTDCRTAAGRLAGAQHQPRRSYAANWINRERLAAA